MATYQDIKGLKVKYLSADPSTLVGGEVWYNSTSGTLKATVLSTAAWTSAPTLSNARTNSAGGGTQTAAFVATGLNMPLVGTYSPTSEEYDGASWTAGGTVVTATGYQQGGGTQTAGIIYGGQSPPSAGITTTQEYDGASWTTGGLMNVSPVPNVGVAYNGVGGGPQTSSVAVGGGGHPDGSSQTVVQTYDGSSWTISPAVYPTPVNSGGFSGTDAAGLCVGGVPSTAETLTNEWNGSAFSTGGTLNTGRQENAASGIQTAALAIGGRSGPGGGSTVVEEYAGSAWAAVPSLANGTDSGVGSGTTSASLVAGGQYAPGNACEEYNGSVTQAQTITVS